MSGSQGRQDPWPSLKSTSGSSSLNTSRGDAPPKPVTSSKLQPNLPLAETLTYDKLHDLTSSEASSDRSTSKVINTKRKLTDTDLPSTETLTNVKTHPPSSSDGSSDGNRPKVVPILPMPLPSKRFKKGQTKSLLIPLEQIPVFPLPPLPVITDKVLETQVYQHLSMFPKVRGRFEDPEDSPAMHYEKLEHVGDSILGMVVTTWLQETKPNLTCGTASVSCQTLHRHWESS